MFDRNRTFVFVVTGSVALLVAGCVGGGGLNLMAPTPDDSPAVSAATPVPQTRSQTYASPSLGVYTEYDGEDIRVHIVEVDLVDNVHSTWRSSVHHATQSSPKSSRLADHSKRIWTLSAPSTAFGDGRTIVVGARWNDDNAEDYLAGGWWFNDYSDVIALDYWYGATAFIDGPELRGDLPDSLLLPLKGQAIYRGEAAGHYESVSEVVCLTDPCPGPPTGSGAGEFSSDATLWADFAHGTIEGCVGCQDGIKMTPTSFDRETGAIERHESESFSLNYLLWLHTGSFLDSLGTLGTFNGDMTALARTGSPDDVEDTKCPAGDAICVAGETLEAPPAAEETETGHAAIPDDEAPSVGWGSWRGRFSNVGDKEGSPRLVGATLEGQFNHTYGDADFAGYLIADSGDHGNRDVSDDKRIVQESKRILDAPGTRSDDPLPVRGMRAPIVDLDGNVHVGADVAPPAELLATSESFGEIEMSSGWVQDGTPVDRVTEFLAPHLGGSTSRAGEFVYTLGYTGLPTFVERPVVRLAAGTSDEFVLYAVRAVQSINSALPYDRRIQLSSEPAPKLTAIENIPDGEIFIDFAASSEDWNLANRNFRPGSAAINEPGLEWEWDAEQERWEAKSMRASHLWFDVERIRNAAWVFNSETGEFEEVLLDKPVTDPEIRVYTEETVFSIMVHELMHAMGFGAHNDIDRFSDSVLRDASLLITSSLPTIDSDALLAAYTRLEPGTEPEELSPQSLGPWSDTSFHVRGDLDFSGGEISFGVASRNGRIQPWASGPSPSTALSDNRELSGTVTWDGALLGMTTSNETVSGTASLAIDISMLSGRLEFGSLKSWGAHSAPRAAVDDGVAAQVARTWGDGDLGYTINVHGSSFVQSGGDHGEVTGSFLGAAHEAMGGVLERSDLSAGFGGTR